MLVVWATLAVEGRAKIVHAALTGVGIGLPIVQSLVLLLNWSRASMEPRKPQGAHMPFDEPQ